MTLLVILIAALLTGLLLWYTRKNASTAVTVTDAVSVSAPHPDVRFTRLSETEVETDPETGRRFKRVMMEKATPRYTWLLGRLKGKYWAEAEDGSGEGDVFVKHYQFHIYEVTFWVNEKEGVSRGKPFAFEADTGFPVHKLPATIPCHVVFEGNARQFGVVLHQPQFSGVRFVRKLQQEEGEELFGTIETEATGYIWDDVTEVNEIIEFLPDIEPVTVQVDDIAAAGSESHVRVEKQGWHRGKGYKWPALNTYRRRGATDDFFTLLFNGIGWLLLCLFVIALLPRLLFLLPLIGAVVLFRIIPAVFWEWLLKIVFGVLLLGWIGVLLFAGRSSTGGTSTVPAVADYDSVVAVPDRQQALEDAAPEGRPIDTLIWHYRKWYDYKGKLYKGRYFIAAGDYQSARAWKNKIAVTGSERRAYDYMLSLLRQHDEKRLTGLYQMFDSIKAAGNLDSLAFAEMMVTCIQQIPYCLVLDKDCNPALYSDPFIRNYLRSENARCDSYERFGINTPVEFMATGKGDCDSRTLLLYTVFRHYGYQVAVLSSEYYSHSLLGIHLPLQGQAYYYNNQPYYCWETTAAGVPAGVLPKEVANLKYWRLSLISQ